MHNSYIQYCYRYNTYQRNVVYDVFENSMLERKSMAKFETFIQTDFDSLKHRIEEGILQGSISASLEDGSDFVEGDCRCSVRVFERYSSLGHNRVSMNVTLFQSNDGPVHVSAITSGGSQAVFFKLNTLGESAFLDCLRNILE